MLLFPNEIIVNIFYYICEPKDYVSLSQTSQLLYHVANDQTVAKSLVGNLYGYENERYNFYTNLICFTKSVDGLLLACKVGNYNYLRNYNNPIKKIRMLLIESCRNDNPQTFLELIKKLKSPNHQPNRFILKKLLKVLCKNNSLKTATHFFKLFDVKVSPTLIKNEKIFEIFWYSDPSCDFLELIYYLCKNDSLAQFKFVIGYLIKTNINIIKRFIDNIVINIKFPDYLLFLLNVLPTETFKVRRCDVLSKMLELKLHDEFLFHFHIFASTKHLDYSVVSSLIKCDGDIMQRLFDIHPELILSMNELGFVHCIAFSLLQSDSLRWHKSVFLLIQHLDPNIDHLDILVGLQTKLILKIHIDGSRCWLRMMNQSVEGDCHHCQQMMLTKENPNNPNNPNRQINMIH